MLVLSCLGYWIILTCVVTEKCKLIRVHNCLGNVEYLKKGDIFKNLKKIWESQGRLKGKLESQGKVREF